MLRRWSPQQNICSSWIFLLLLVCFAIQPILLVLLLRDTSSTKVGSPNQTPFFGSNEMNEQQDSLSSSKYQLKRGSSLVCTNTTDVNHRFCRLNNICSRSSPRGRQYMFFHGPDTLMENVPLNRYQPALASLSSVMNHNVQFFNYDDYRADLFNFSMFNIEMITRPAFLFRRFKPDNIMHILHDDLLPIFFSLRLMFGSDWEAVQLVCEDEFPQNLSTTKLFRLISQHPIMFLNKKQVDDTSLICFQTWYDYGFDKPQGRIQNKVVDGRDIRLFTRHIRQRLGIQDQPTIYPTSPIVIFSRTQNRLIINQAQLVEKLYGAYGVPVVIIRMETHTFEDQIRVLSQTRAAIGMHGSILIMGMFLPPSAVIFELYPYAINPEHYTPYRDMANLPGMNLKYASWANTLEAYTLTYENRPPHLGGISHFPANLKMKAPLSSSVSLFHQMSTLRRSVISLIVFAGDVLDILNVNMMQGEKFSSIPDEFLFLIPSKPQHVTCAFSEVKVDNSDKANDTFMAIARQEKSSMRTQSIWVRAVTKMGLCGPFSSLNSCSSS
eukprot:gene9015-1344_t